jgi:signal transduction histidine kinase
MRKLRSYYQYLIGSETDFVLENRITNAVFLITVILMSMSLVLSLVFVGFSSAIGLYAIAVVMESVLYYFSRFRKAYKSTIAISTVLSYGLLAYSYFSRSGLDGPTMFSFLLVFQLVITILPRKQHWIWITINIGVLYVLLYTDYTTPGAVTAAYLTPAERFSDLAINYGVSAIFIYLITTTLSNSYLREKRLAEARARDIAIQNGKLGQLLQEKDKLFSIITHDLRSPLNSIQGYLEMLQQYDLPAEEKQQMENELLEFTKETSDMLFNTLTWAKSQMQGFEVNVQPMNIDEIINQTLAIQKTIASKKNIAIRYKALASAQAIGDKELFQVIIRNLVSNAIKFTPSNGEITIDTAMVGNECTVSVSDNGIGIPPEKQATLFTLSSASTAGTDNEKGIGLGLTICKEFMDMQHGRIWIDSQVKTGTTFKLALPARRA